MKTWSAPQLARQLADVLEAAAIPHAIGGALERGDFKFYVSRMRVDVFIASIPFYDQVRRRIRRAVLEGRPAWFLAPEDLIVFKLLFFRTKDLLDVERLVEFLGEQLDRRLVDSALADLVGPADERVGWWERLVSDPSRGE